jgi:hypothetical protein
MIALGETGTCDLWSIRIDEAVFADAAQALVAGWNAANAAPPDGLAHVALRIHAQNLATVRRLFGSFRFLMSGSDGVLRSSPDLAIPQPSEGIVDPQQALDGWMVFLADAGSRPLLWFADGLMTPDWQEGAFALHAESAMPDLPRADRSGIVAGLTPEQPAAPDEPVLAGDWIVSLEEIIEGQAVLDRGGAGVQALARSSPGLIPSWLAVRLTIVNASDHPALFSPSAVQIADETGDPWAHILALTPPAPDASVHLLPGASRVGWAGFQRADYNNDKIFDADDQLLRILPSPLVDEPRWIALSGGATSSPEPSSEDWAAGDMATIAEDRVNLRAEPSRTGAVIAELPQGERVRIEGDVVEADALRWVPVSVVASGKQGYVVADYITPTA